MVGMLLQDANGAIELLGEYNADQGMGQSQRRERPDMRGARLEACREPIGTADDENGFGRGVAPARDVLGKLCGRPATSAFIKRDQLRAFRQRGLDTRAFSLEQLVYRQSEAFLGFDLDQLKAIFAAEPPREFLVAL